MRYFLKYYRDDIIHIKNYYDSPTKNIGKKPFPHTPSG